VKTIQKIVCKIKGHKYKMVGALSELNLLFECVRCGQRSISVKIDWEKADEDE